MNKSVPKTTGSQANVGPVQGCPRCNLSKYSVSCSHDRKIDFISNYSGFQILELVADKTNTENRGLYFDEISIVSELLDGCKNGKVDKCPSYTFESADLSKKISLKEKIKINAPDLNPKKVSWDLFFELLKDPKAKYSKAKITAHTCSGPAHGVEIRVYNKVEYGGKLSLSFDREKLRNGKPGRPQEGFWKFGVGLYLVIGGYKHQFDANSFPLKLTKLRDLLKDVIDKIGPSLWKAADDKKYSVIWPNFSVTGSTGIKESAGKNLETYGQVKLDAAPFMGADFKANIMPWVTKGIMTLYFGPAGKLLAEMLNSYIDPDSGSVKVALYLGFKGEIGTGTKGIYIQSRDVEWDIGGSFDGAFTVYLEGEASADISFWIIKVQAGAKVGANAKFGLELKGERIGGKEITLQGYGYFDGLKIVYEAYMNKGGPKKGMKPTTPRGKGQTGGEYVVFDSVETEKFSII